MQQEATILGIIPPAKLTEQLNQIRKLHFENYDENSPPYIQVINPFLKGSECKTVTNTELLDKLKQTESPFELSLISFSVRKHEPSAKWNLSLHTLTPRLTQLQQSLYNTFPSCASTTKTAMTLNGSQNIRNI